MLVFTARTKSGKIEMFASKNKQYVSAAVCAACVFLVVFPGQLRLWRIEVVGPALAAVMALVLYLNDSRVSIVAAMTLLALCMHWKGGRFAAGAEAPGTVDAFTVRAPHDNVPDDPSNPSGRDVYLSPSAGARVSFGAGSQAPLPDPGMTVEDLQNLSPPELLHAAQTNEIPR